MPSAFDTSNQQIAMRVSRVTIFWNTALALFKFFAGIAARSSAMLSDAVHSASDIFSTVIVIIGVRAAGKEADREHPYGHERMECVAAVLLSFALFATGAGVGVASIRKICWVGRVPLAPPGGLALWAAAVSIAVKEAMYWYTKAAARVTGSAALEADAWHHRSDAFSSVGSLAGIAGARLGLPVLDPVAGLVICALILKVSVSIFIDSMDKMIDKACDSRMVLAIAEKVMDQSGVLGIDLINTRMFGNRIYVDVEIRSDGSTPLRQSHEIAKRVHDSIETSFPAVKHCMVHVNPAEDTD